MNEVANLGDCAKECSVLQDCFQNEYFKELNITLFNKKELRPSYFPSKLVWIRIQFCCGNTFGEQRMEADSLVEAFEKIAAFQKELEKRAQTSEPVHNCKKNE